MSRREQLEQALAKLDTFDPCVERWADPKFKGKFGLVVVDEDELQGLLAACGDVLRAGRALLGDDEVDNG